jgi:hypothetical protein
MMASRIEPASSAWEALRGAPGATRADPARRHRQATCRAVTAHASGLPRDLARIWHIHHGEESCATACLQSTPGCPCEFVEDGRSAGRKG